MGSIQTLVAKLLCKGQQELTKLNSKETNNTIMKWAKYMNKNLTEEDTDMANKHDEKLFITGHQGNTKQNHNEISPHTSENGEH